jgi:primase-polymerase (primpol)-like protein
MKRRANCSRSCRRRNSSKTSTRACSYAEISPSRRGLKVFIKANKPGKRCRKAYHDGGIEIYDRDRFFTVTGERLPNYPVDINLRQQSLDLVYGSVFGGDEPGAAVSSNRGPSPSTDDRASAALSDNEIIELACKKPRTGDKFRSLWDGNWNDHYNSASEADSSVVFTLAYYTKDAAQIDRIFRQSKLMRSKWDQLHGSETYGATTISKALSIREINPTVLCAFLKPFEGYLRTRGLEVKEPSRFDNAAIEKLVDILINPTMKTPQGLLNAVFC